MGSQPLRVRGAVKRLAKWLHGLTMFQAVMFYVVCGTLWIGGIVLGYHHPWALYVSGIVGLIATVIAPALADSATETVYAVGPGTTNAPPYEGRGDDENSLIAAYQQQRRDDD